LALSLRALAPVVGIALTPGLACSGPNAQSELASQLSADGPCYQTNLADGIEEVEELHLAFACLNKGGHFDSLAGVDRALDAPIGPSSVGMELVAAVGSMDSPDLELLSSLGELADLLDAPHEPVDNALDLVLELSYGVAGPTARQADFDGRAALAGGPLQPLMPVLPDFATSLGRDPAARDVLASVISSAELARWVHTFAAFGRSSDPEVAQLRDQLGPSLGAVAAAVNSPSNDRWRSASGHSLRDLAAVFVGGAEPVLPTMLPPVERALSDQQLRAELIDTFLDLQNDGVLDEFGSELAWFTNIDPNGGDLRYLESSAFAAFLRLLHGTNRPMDCSVNLLVTDLEISLGNLAVTVLDTIADLDPTQVEDLTSLVSDILGSPVSAWVIEQIVATEVCPAFTEQVYEDLAAVNALKRPEARNLINTIIALLQDLKSADEDHLIDVANIATALVDAGGVEPLEEFIRDLGPEPLVPLLMDTLPLLYDPSDYGIRVPDGEPANLDAALEVMYLLAAPTENAPSGWAAMEPSVAPVLAHDGLWTALDRLAPVLEDERSTLHNPVMLVVTLEDLDPQLSSLQSLGAGVRNPEITLPLLRVLEEGTLAEELFATTEQGGHPPPLAWFRERVMDGSIDDLLEIVQRALALVGLSDS